MISEFKFFSDLNFYLKNNESFIVFKKPSHNKIICLYGDVLEGQINDFDNKKGFLFMPFDSETKGYLLTPKITTETEFHLKISNNSNQQLSIKEFNSKKNSYINFIDKTINDIKSSELEKVVCSSIFNLKLNYNSSIEYFKKLLQLNHDAFCYLFYHPEIGVWIGASPEKLIDLNNNIVTTFALAATKKDMNQSWTDKEFREQKIVEEQIVNDLSSVCTNIETGSIQTVKAGNIFHLKSVIKARTKKSSSGIINLLHPTPAVAGTPKSKAIDYINQMENYNRSFYTGFMGLFEKNSCDIYVNIRCAKIVDDNLSIYVGGGITKDSNALDEWTEIVNKSQTMLGVFYN
ncbi:MAG: hypothetical protein CMC36_00355 [Flavobacteriaceae bacterium]|nr:hypothetical protein [Flavobacteriaceae bacterium]|tara:strand:+ start:1038 stop:2078 length:1041 start_codon:yes stop_codon:yes gene_type:complete